MVAALAIVTALRRLWRIQHPRRRQVLPAAGVLAVLVGLFFVSEARVLFIG